MKIMLDIDNHGVTRKDDILIYDGKIYTTISKQAFLRNEIIVINKLSSDLENALKRIENLENQLKYDHGEIEENDLGTN